MVKTKVTLTNAQKASLLCPPSPIRIKPLTLVSKNDDKLERDLKTLLPKSDKSDDDETCKVDPQDTEDIEEFESTSPISWLPTLKASMPQKCTPYDCTCPKWFDTLTNTEKIDCKVYKTPSREASDPVCPGAPKKVKPVDLDRDRVDIEAYKAKTNKYTVISAMYRDWINTHGGLPSFSNRRLALDWCEMVKVAVTCQYPKDPDMYVGRANLNEEEEEHFVRECEDYMSGSLYPWVFNWRAPSKSERAGMKLNHIEDPRVEDYKVQEN